MDVRARVFRRAETLGSTKGLFDRSRRVQRYENLIDGAPARGRFGDLVGQESFCALLARADQFKPFKQFKSFKPLSD